MHRPSRLAWPLRGTTKQQVAVVTEHPREDVKELLYPVVPGPALLSQEPDALGAPTRLRSGVPHYHLLDV